VEGAGIDDTSPRSYAVTPEVGVLLLRGNRFGRFSASVQGFILTSHDFVRKNSSDRLDNFVSLSLKAML
jgi:hypothetical protein